jgi:uncharacterized membrane protein YozB (DUF420 family)
MKSALNEHWKNVGKLIRFVFWYAIGLAALFYLLPMAARLAEASYDAMNGMAKIFTVVGFLALVALWQLRSRRKDGD